MVKHSKNTPLSAKGNAILCIAAPIEEGAQHVGHLVACPVLTQEISGVLGTRNVPEVHDLSGDRFPCTMVRECSPTFIQLGVRDTATRNHGFIITEHHGPTDRDTEAAEGETDGNPTDLPRRPCVRLKVPATRLCRSARLMVPHQTD